MLSVCSLGDDKRARDCAGMGKFVFSVPSGGTHTPSLPLTHRCIACRENLGNVIVSQKPHCPFSCYDYFGPLFPGTSTEKKRKENRLCSLSTVTMLVYFYYSHIPISFSHLTRSPGEENFGKGGGSRTLSSFIPFI